MRNGRQESEFSGTLQGIRPRRFELEENAVLVIGGSTGKDQRTGSNLLVMVGLRLLRPLVH